MKTRGRVPAAALTAALHVAASGAVAAQAARERPGLDEGAVFRVYHREGGDASLDEVVSSALSADVLLVGEEHDDGVAHALELELLRRLADRSSRLVVLSLEMFERDVQVVLDEYLAGLVTEQHFLLSARPWDHYGRRYRALVEEAKARELPVIASNAPRRYVNRVTREGPASLNALSARAKRYLPPLPYPGPSERYRVEWDSVMAEARQAASNAGDTLPPEEGAPPPGGGHDGSGNRVQAQALWDAAMGHAIATALMAHLDALVLHVAGSFHVARGTGIPERIADYRPGTRVVTVVIVPEEDARAWQAAEHGGLADFVILTRQEREGSGEDGPGAPPGGAGPGASPGAGGPGASPGPGGPGASPRGAG